MSVRIELRTFDVACLAGLAAFALFGGVGTVKSASGKVGGIERQNRAVEAQVEELKKAEAILGTLSVALQSNQTALEALRLRLPERQDIGSFLAALDAMAIPNRVVVLSVVPGALARESLCTKTPVELACRGSFANLHILLHQLENMDRLVRVRHVSLSRGGLSEDCTLNASCDVYGR